MVLGGQQRLLLGLGYDVNFLVNAHHVIIIIHDCQQKLVAVCACLHVHMHASLSPPSHKKKELWCNGLSYIHM